MALGRRKGEVQQDLFITADQLPKSIGHVFYRKLNELLAEAGFDRWVEDLCGPYYSQGKGRPGIPPGVYFRMLIVGYFEGLQSCRGQGDCAKLGRMAYSGSCVSSAFAFAVERESRHTCREVCHGRTSVGFDCRTFR